MLNEGLGNILLCETGVWIGEGLYVPSVGLVLLGISAIPGRTGANKVASLTQLQTCLP